MAVDDACESVRSDARDGLAGSTCSVISLVRSSELDTVREDRREIIPKKSPNARGGEVVKGRPQL